MTSAVCTAVIFTCQAQKGIIDELQSSTIGEGTIRIAVDDAVSTLLGTPAVESNFSDNSVSVKVDGFRIVVYMGNNPKKSKNEAAYRQMQIYENFPEMKTYIRYEAPVWKVFAGDFLSREAAVVVLRDMQKMFPEFGKEMYIVFEKINFPLSTQ
ncbi:MAG: SPOR domain-containing protein [Dysgonamonadaceae bacterium]|nr:SPOR domain-containing protein [Dysgonamonadaceae bacterium]